MGQTGLEGEPSFIGWHPDYGYAFLGNHPHVVMLARVDTLGHTVQPPGCFYDGGSNRFITFSAAAIAPNGRVVVLWGERQAPDTACTTLKMAWVDWTTYLGAHDRDFILHPSSFILSAFPNPFNAQTEIRFALPQAARAELALFDILGRRVATLADGAFTAGEHSVPFDGSNLGSGIYFARLSASHRQTALKLMLIR
ncbi:MAG: T9SS type A sorting domain-containing protein [bacterium]|nr:T9SS type A sorting domain-containing protein [bacterium]